MEQPLSDAVPASAQPGSQDGALGATEQMRQFTDAEGKRPAWCLLPRSWLHRLPHSGAR